MGFKLEALESFNIMLDTLREDDPEACVLRYPVTKAGSDIAGAADYDALQSPSPDQLTLQEGGFLDDYMFSVTMRTDDFETLPSVGKMLKMNGRVARVLKVENVDVASLILVHCGTPNK